jgi:maltose/moltooligosaccharide transporter
MRRIRTRLELFNMNFGFFGIQFGWTLQMTLMSAIYEFLGASPDQIPGLWLAAPLTGLLVQPIIGMLSDRTWGPLGRRRPYFLTGAILSTIALVAMPNVTTLKEAALLLWVLDASINVSMEPFRAFVSDLLADQQRTKGFATQSVLIGLASVFAATLVYVLSHVNLPVSTGAIPISVRYAFYIGAVAFISTVVWTVVTTGEYPPEDAPAGEPVVKQNFKLPAELWRLAPVQMLTWLGLFCMFLYLTPTVAYHIFAAPNEKSGLYLEGVGWAGLGAAFQNLVTFGFSFCLEPLAKKIGESRTHASCLLIGGLGLASIALVHDKWMLFLPMACVGIAWASILSLPYSILSRSIQPESAGLTMGVFNFFIVLPEILMATCFKPIMKNVLHENRLAVLVLGGVCLASAALLAIALLENRPPTKGVEAAGENLSA